MGLSARLALAAFALGLAGGVALADAVYHGRAIVTGELEPERSRGFALAFKDALVEASGDVRLLEDPRVDALAAHAKDDVLHFRYRDRMAGIPHHDEQGSHDRPFDLIVDFDGAKIEHALASLGVQPWTGQRPIVAAFVAVSHGDEHFDLSSDGDEGVDQRAALADAADRYGIELVLPGAERIASARIDDLLVPPIEAGRFVSLAQDLGGDVPLVGSLVWSDQPGGWNGDWRLVAQGRVYRWHVDGVSFDAAFQNAILGAAQILSGHGAPAS